MRITDIDIIHADGGWQTWSFLKIRTDADVVGWSEFSAIRVGALPAVIRHLAEALIGKDPRDTARIGAQLETATRLTEGGLNRRAAAAIENACLDIKAKALGISVAALFGGAVRERLPVYWSHCGLYRAMVPDLFESFGAAPVRRLDDLRAVGAEAAAMGHTCLKTNLLLFDENGGALTLNRRATDPSRKLDARMIGALRRQLDIIREGAGPGMGLMVDLNFAFKPAGFRSIAQALEDAGLTWLELDLYDPRALADIRAGSRTPIASLEAIYGCRALLPYLQQGAVDVAIVDMMWNGLPEAMRMASLADIFHVNVAVHTAGSPFHAMMGAHFAAAIPNLDILEFDADIVPWARDVFSALPRIEAGAMHVPDGPGWGVEIDEAALRAHPPTRPI